LEETELKLELIEKRTTGGTLAEIRSWLRTKRNIKISVDKLSRRFHKWGVFCDQRKRAVRRAAKRARRAQEKPELKWLTCPQCGRYPFDSGKACKCGFKMGAR
jgi:transposase